jgi:hypothetical protein
MEQEAQAPGMGRKVKLGLVAAGLVAGGAIGLSGVASAADTPTPSPSTGSATSGHLCDKDGHGPGGAGDGRGQAPTTAPDAGSSTTPDSTATPDV